MVRLLFSLLIIFGGCQDSSHQQKDFQSSRLQTLHNPTSNLVLTVAHRALHTKYPENSLAAVRHSIESGLDMIEIDVRRTKDGILILMHDESLERTTNGTGRVRDLTYAEIMQFTLKENANDASIHPIPTLEEVLQVSKDHILVDLDIKAAPVKELVDMVKKTGTGDQVLFFQHYNATHDSILSIDPGLMIVPRADSAEQVLNFIKQYHPLVIQIPSEVASETLVKQMKTAGCAVWVNALGAADKLAEAGKVEDAFAPLVKKGANLIQGDQPVLLLNFLKTSKLHW
jgi:glycerophosphoryl diester phosphodiesterase